MMSSFAPNDVRRQLRLRAAKASSLTPRKKSKFLNASGFGPVIGRGERSLSQREGKDEGTRLARGFVVYRGLDLILAGWNFREVVDDLDEELAILNPASQSRSGEALAAADQPPILGLDLEIERKIDDVHFTILAVAIAHGLGIEDEGLAPLECVALMEVVYPEAFRIGGDEYRLGEEQRRFLPYLVLCGSKGCERLAIVSLPNLTVSRLTGIGELARRGACRETQHGGCNHVYQNGFHESTPPGS